jgi:hypothetical protein
MADTLIADPTTPVTPSVQPAPVPVIPAPTPAPGPTDWRAVLPADLQAAKTLEKFKTRDDVVRAYVQLEQHQGRSLTPPGPDATPEQRQAFFAKFDALRGVPESPEKYTITAPEGLPLDPEAVKTWQQTFHELKLSQEQVQGLAARFLGSPMGNPALMIQDLNQQGEQEVRAFFGGAFEAKVRAAQEGALHVEQASGATKLREKLNARGLGNDPDVIKAMAYIGEMFREGGAIPADAMSGDFLSPERANERAAELRKELMTPGLTHARRQDLLDEMARVYEAKVGHAR